MASDTALSRLSGRWEVVRLHDQCWRSGGKEWQAAPVVVLLSLARRSSSRVRYINSRYGGGLEGYTAPLFLGGVFDRHW